MLTPKSKNLPRPVGPTLPIFPRALDNLQFWSNALSRIGRPLPPHFRYHLRPPSLRERGFIFWRTKLLSIKRRRWPPLRFYGPRERAVGVRSHLLRHCRDGHWMGRRTDGHGPSRERRISSRSHFLVDALLRCYVALRRSASFHCCESDNADIFFAPPFPAKN